MSQACSTFPFSQKNSLNTLEAMESHLEAEVEGWVMTAHSLTQSSEDGVIHGLSSVTPRFLSELIHYLFTFNVQ